MTTEKLGHIALFTLFAYLILVAGGWWYIAVAVLLAGLTELGQRLLGWGRHGEWADVLRDLAGIAIGTIIYALTRHPLGAWVLVAVVGAFLIYELESPKPLEPK